MCGRLVPPTLHSPTRQPSWHLEVHCTLHCALFRCTLATRPRGRVSRSALCPLPRILLAHEGLGRTHCSRLRALGTWRPCFSDRRSGPFRLVRGVDATVGFQCGHFCSSLVRLCSSPRPFVGHEAQHCSSPLGSPRFGLEPLSLAGDRLCRVQDWPLR